MKQYRQQPYVRKGPRRQLTAESLYSGYKRTYVTGRRARRLAKFYPELLRRIAHPDYFLLPPSITDPTLDTSPEYEYPEVAPPAKPVPGNR